MNSMTPRETYWNDLLTIADITGSLYRRMSFQEADEWLTTYDCERHEGYPSDMAALRAFDCHFAGRRVLG